jgi:hypothetical protein
MLAKFSLAKSRAEGQIPTYSRQLSDPTFAEGQRVELKPSHRIVLVEGNYLLLRRNASGVATSTAVGAFSSSSSCSSSSSYSGEGGGEGEGSAGEEYDPHSCVGLDERSYCAHIWADLSALWDEKWFIECPTAAIQRERLVLRHLETWTAEKTALFGEGRDGAGRKADTNDVINAKMVSSICREHADRIILSVNEEAE